jgi:Ca2+-binding EF-hand superfamily protein
MRRGVKLLGVVAAAGLAAAAQAHDGPMGPPPGGMFGGGPPPMGGPGGFGGPGAQGWQPPAPDAAHVAHLLARAADADKSGDVTAAEWAAFLASLNPDAATGAVDMTALAAALPPAPPGAPADALTHLLDKDGDGVVTTADLNAFFAVLDTNGDGALSASELGPPPDGHGPGCDHGGPGGTGDAGGSDGGAPQGPPPEARAVAAMLAHAADADKSGDVTAAEWAAFLASLNPDATTGAVDMTALASALEAARPQETKSKALKRALKHVRKAAKSGQDTSTLLVQLLDHDGDGVVETSDLQWFFGLLDTNGDGALSAAELAPPPVLHGGDERAVEALLHAADADKSGDVTAAEWAAFLGGLVVDASGAVSLDDLAAKIGAPTPPSGDTTRRDAMLTHAFDRDGDGVVTKADLQAIFDMADANADGALGSSELHSKR